MGRRGWRVFAVLVLFVAGVLVAVSGVPANEYNYVWKTDSGWRGCRMLIVKVVDGSYHRALFNFGS
jgi:hypothetical protein